MREIEASTGWDRAAGGTTSVGRSCSERYSPSSCWHRSGWLSGTSASCAGLRRDGGHGRAHDSVLVPARNEEASIRVRGRAAGSGLPEPRDHRARRRLDRRHRRHRARPPRPASPPRSRGGAAGRLGARLGVSSTGAQAHGDVLCLIDAPRCEPRRPVTRRRRASRSDLGLVSMLLAGTGTTSEAVLMPIVNYGLLALCPPARREARLPQGGDRPRTVRHGHSGCVHHGRGARRRACAHRRRRAARPVGEGLRTPHRAPQRDRPRPHPVVHRLWGDLERLLEEV